MWNAIKLVSSNLNSEIKLPRGCGGVSDKRMRVHDDRSPMPNLAEIIDM